MQDSSSKASRNIKKRYSVQDYEGVCLEVGKFLEKIIKQISRSDDRGTNGALDRLISEKKLRPVLANNFKSAWELRNIAAHDSNYVFSKDNSVISIIAFNEINRWFYSYFHNAKFSDVYANFENSDTPLLADISNVSERELTEIRGSQLLMPVTKQYSSSYVKDYDSAKKWVVSNPGYRAYRDFTFLVKSILENRGLIPKENRKISEVIDALDDESADISLKKVFRMFYTYYREGKTVAPAIENSYYDDIEWLKSIKLGGLIEQVDRLFPRYTREFMRSIQVDY